MTYVTATGLLIIAGLLLAVALVSMIGAHRDLRNIQGDTTTGARDGVSGRGVDTISGLLDRAEASSREVVGDDASDTSDAVSSDYDSEYHPPAELAHVAAIATHVWEGATLASLTAATEGTYRVSSELVALVELSGGWKGPSDER